jgi:hypothetical protein
MTPCCSYIRFVKVHTGHSVRTAHTFVQAFSFSTPTTQLHERTLQSTYLLPVQTQARVLAHSFHYSSHSVPECGRILVSSEILSTSCCQPPQRNNNTTNLQSTSSLHNHARLLLQSFSCIFIFLSSKSATEETHFASRTICPCYANTTP